MNVRSFLFLQGNKDEGGEKKRQKKNKTKQENNYKREIIWIKNGGRNVS